MRTTLNIYNHWNFARYAFNTARRNLKEGDVTSHKDLIIKNESDIAVYTWYTNEKDFFQKYLQGWIWNEISGYVNLPYDLRLYTQSRILQE